MISDYTSRASEWFRNKGDDIRYFGFRMLPDRFFGNMKGKWLVNAYLNGNGSLAMPRSRRYLTTPGSRSNIMNYLSSDEGRSKLPDIVGKHLGDQWYTGIAKQLTKIPMVGDMVLDKISDKIMPSVHGSKDIAKAFATYGGAV